MTGTRARAPLALTILGSSCSIPRPGRACSSYLLETERRAIVLDFGSGAFANLVRHRSAESIDAIVVSHMHADHFLDVIPLRYALTYGARTHDRKVPLYLPPGGDGILRALVAAFPAEPGQDFIGDVFDVRTYDPARPLEIDDATLRFAPTRHYIPTYAIRCDAGGTAIAYSSDTAPTQTVCGLAKASDLFLCEATLAATEEGLTPRGHSSAREAGAMAHRAEAGRLVLTHYPASADRETLVAEARAGYAGRIDVADDGDTF